ncbi:peroxidase 17-like [Impatiens glandulifera]|uniref:peroxidase 17-like n=1 Tax=Impatiens glandulifera TaxID=253017 RepID=UPI001FB16132|nr:peroxidase 17-like [Impatiens glandulifera]
MFPTSSTVSFFFFFFLISLAALHGGDGASHSKLRHGYYSTTCPAAEITVKKVIRKNMISEPRSAASVMRLQFHDCFVNGCDASLLLDDTPNMLGEKESFANGGSLRRYDIIDEAKANLERICPGVVSCADIIIMAARDAVFFSGGPDWAVKLGRKDGLTASLQDSNDIMPTPRANATYLLGLFQRFNLSAKDLVALSGSHSIGKGDCIGMVFRLYNQSGSGKPDPAMEIGYRKRMEKFCPPWGAISNVTVDLDPTPKVFDNKYYKELIKGKGFFNSDQSLYTLPETRKYVERFSRGEKEFFEAFAKGMIKMGDLQSGRSGEIRRNCRVVNHHH